MYVVANRIYVRSAFAPQFEQAFAGHSGDVNRVSGLVRNLVLRPNNPDEQPYIVMNFWESMEAFHAWTQSESFRRAHAGMRHSPQEMYWQANQLEIHEVIQDSGVARE
jgi:heme-degrading monooxygenase HmoA